MTTPTGTGQGQTASIGELIGDISRDLSTLIRQEIELAKAEVRQSARQAGRGAGLLGAAGTAAVMALLFLSVAVWWALGNATGRGWSALVVAIVWTVLALVFGASGKKQVTEVRGLPQTTETARRIPDAMKGKDEGLR